MSDVDGMIEAWRTCNAAIGSLSRDERARLLRALVVFYQVPAGDVYEPIPRRAARAQ